MLVRDDRPTINFLDSYRKHYRGRSENVFVCDAVPVGDGTDSVQLTFACDAPSFDHFELDIIDAKPMNSTDGIVVATFENATKWTAKYRVVDNNATSIASGEITAILSKTEPNNPEGTDTIVTIGLNPPLEHYAPLPASFAASVSDEEREFARKQWGEHVSAGRTDYEKAKILAKILCDELWPHSGTPIPEMELLAPFEMYEKMIDGKSEGFCVQFAMIFVRACLCFDILARNIHMERPFHYGKDMNIFLKGMHSTSEIFDRDLDRWIFMDLRFYCLGAYLGDEGPLSIGEFHLFMNQPHWRNRLRFQIYDMASNSEKRLPMNECPRTNIDFYSLWNTVFHIGYE